LAQALAETPQVETRRQETPTAALPPVELVTAARRCRATPRVATQQAVTIRVAAVAMEPVGPVPAALEPVARAEPRLRVKRLAETAAEAEKAVRAATP
jgi:hypothetical protein